MLSWFYGFYGGFYTLDLLNQSQCQSTEKLRNPDLQEKLKYTFQLL